jgi:hypothetical protein
MTDNKQELIKEHSAKGRTIIWIIVFLLFVVIAAVLYINFQFSYKFVGIDQKISELNNAQQVSNIIKTVYPNQQIVEQSDKPVLENNQNNFYVQLLKFTQDFYLMKENIDKGNDFSIQALELSKYDFVSTELKNCISQLISLGAQNISTNLLQEEFHSLIPSLYKKESMGSSFFSLKNRVLVRAIGERALKQEGLDRDVFLIEHYLIQGNLKQVAEIIKNLSIDVPELNVFIEHVNNRLAIEDNLKNIEMILLSSSNSMIEGR